MKVLMIIDVYYKNINSLQHPKPKNFFKITLLRSDCIFLYGF